MDFNKCFVCGNSLEESNGKHTGHDIDLREVETGEVLSSELEGYLCEDCKNRISEFVAGMKVLYDFIKEQKEAENDSRASKIASAI